MKSTIQGIHAHRLKQGPWEDRERAFAAAWEEEIKRNLLARLLCPTPGDEVNPSERDYEVAATVIQWLGTDVGIWFLNDVLTKVGLRIDGNYFRHLKNTHGPDWATQDGKDDG